MTPGEKAAITRKVGLLSKLISKYRADRGLWEHMTEDELNRNRRFLSNIEAEMRHLMKVRHEAEGGK